MMRALRALAATVCAVTAAAYFIACAPVEDIAEPPQPYLYIMTDTATVEAGSSITLVARSSEQDPAMLWLSDSDAVATVKDGVVSGVSAGRARITALTEDCVAMIDITVTTKPAPSVLILAAQNMQVERGASVTLTAVAPSGAEITWDSSDPAVATVENGVVVGLNEGVAVITASALGVKAECAVTVQPPSGVVPVLSLDKTYLALAPDEVARITATSNGATVYWFSTDESVVKVDNGAVLAAGVGSATVFAVTNSAVATCAVTVKQPQKPPVTVTLNQTSVTVEAGSTHTLVATSSDGSPVTWSSGNTAVVTVSTSGVVTAKSKGTAVVTASSGDAKAQCLVTVKEQPKPVTVALNKTSVSLEAGKTYTLVATVSDGSAVTWSSGNTAVATVSASGVVTAKSKGTAVVTAAAAGGALARCTVTVHEALQPTDPAKKDGYTLVWRDEFDGAALDTSKWGYQIGTKDLYSGSPDYWGNRELQYYTQDAVSLAGGNLVITAKRQNMGDRNYTSGRILTRGKYSVTYGYVEARMKLPKGNGMWPAFWMLPEPLSSNYADTSANEYGGWAASGEIDIMEAKGRLLNKIDTTLHFGGPWPDNRMFPKTYTMDSDIDEWHTYAVNWTADYIAWDIDGVEVARANNAVYYSTAAPDDPSAPFDKPFYILFNFAVGGSYDPEGTDAMLAENTFTQASMYVDYVRVYKPN